MVENAKSKTHPCFNKEAKLKYARIHLPVAPKCNVQCGYCNRKYDCVNESRPGVTSSVLTPYQSVNYLRAISQKIENISTIGIAGPGDAFAEPERTLEAVEMIKSEFPEKIFCLSTNGLNLEPYVAQLAKLDVTHVTITINSIRPETAGKIYSWIRHNKKVYRGLEAGKIIVEQQMKGLAALVEHGITVKINSIIIPGVNEGELAEVAEKVASMGAHTMNCIPLIPTAETAFEDTPKPTHTLIKEVNTAIAEYIKPMTHCARCRADAAGLIGKDNKDAYNLISQCAAAPVAESPIKKPHVAVASYEGLMINKHLGEAKEFLIYTDTEDGYKLIEKRQAPQSGSGDLRWVKLAKTLDDCAYVLVNGVGAKPVEVMQRVGVAVVEMSGMIEDGLDAVYKGKKLKSVLKTNLGKCGDSCSGNGMGCG